MSRLADPVRPLLKTSAVATLLRFVRVAVLRLRMNSSDPDRDMLKKIVRRAEALYALSAAKATADGSREGGITGMKRRTSWPRTIRAFPVA